MDIYVNRGTFMKNFIIQFLVLLPLAIIQTFLGITEIMMWFFPSNMGSLEGGALWFSRILITAVLLGINKIVRLIRFGKDTEYLYILFDFLTAPIRFFTQFIAVFIAFLALFTEIDSDANCEPYGEGFFNAITLYLFCLNINSNFGGDISNGKMTNLVFNIILTPIALFCSLPGIMYVSMNSSAIAERLVGDPRSSGFIALAYSVLYLVFGGIWILARGYGGSAVTGYIEKKSTHYYQEDFFGDYNYVGTETRNVNKTTISLMGIVYIIISPLFFIFQIISLVTSIILPTQDNRLVSFYKADFDEYDVYPSFGALLLHFTTGIIVTY